MKEKNEPNGVILKYEKRGPIRRIGGRDGKRRSPIWRFMYFNKDGKRIFLHPSVVIEYSKKMSERLKRGLKV